MGTTQKKTLEQENTNKFKITFLGESSVGKTSIILRFVTGEFNQSKHCVILKLI